MSYEPSRELVNRLANEIEVAGTRNLIPLQDANAIASALRGQRKGVKVVLFTPIRVDADLSNDLIDLRYARCSHCGKIVRLSSISAHERKKLKCSDCKGPLVPAPNWCITVRDRPSQTGRRITTNQGIKIGLSVEHLYTRQPGRSTPAEPSAAVIKDRSRPVASLYFVYGEEEKYAPIRLQHSNYEYLLSLMPSESITKPVTITAFAYDPNKCSEVKTTTGELKGVAEILFCTDLEVLQTTVLYKAGHPRSSSIERAAVLPVEKNPMGGDIISIPARLIITKGIIVKVDKDLVADALRELGSKDVHKDMWMALHTISHAFLVNLPRVTGLEGGDFGEAISTSANEIAIYDNSMGGLGGVEGIASGGYLSANYEWSVRDSYKCPLACIKACRACLYTDSCFMLNWSLDRRILRELDW